jgi:hypothetical protein
MTDYGTEITTPLARIVWGHPGKMTDKTDPDTRQPVRNADGTIKQQCSFGLAIPKGQEGPLYAAMQAEAAKGYPNGIPGKFSWKLKDGDGIDSNGKPYSEREGHAGCWILAVASEFQAPPLYVWQNGAYMQIQPDKIKTGDYVMCGLNLKVNVPRDRTHTPGLYVNPLSVLLMYEGDEIKTGYQADPNALFGQQPQQAAMPAGARPIGAGGPVGGQPPAGAGMPGMQQQMPGNGPMAQPTAPAPGVMPQQGPSAPPMQPASGAYPSNPPQMPPPATDFIPGAPQQPQYQQPQGYPTQPGGMPGMPPPR